MERWLAKEKKEYGLVEDSANHSLEAAPCVTVWRMSRQESVRVWQSELVKKAPAESGFCSSISSTSEICIEYSKLYIFDLPTLYKGLEPTVYTMNLTVEGYIV